MLDIRWLEDLRAVAEAGSITRAAELRAVTQSGLSRRLQSLEHWAGEPLLDRAAQPIALTPAGRAVLAVAEEVLPRLGEVRRRLSDGRRSEARRLRLASPHILSAIFLPGWLPLIGRAWPGPGRPLVEVLSEHLPVCAAALDDGRAQLMAWPSDPRGRSLDRLPERLRPAPPNIVRVGRERLVPLSAPASPLTRSPLHALGPDLPPPALLGYAPECTLGWALDAAREGWHDLPILPRDPVVMNSFADGLRLSALAGAGIAWLPLGTTIREREAGMLVPAAAPGTYEVPLDILLARPAWSLPAPLEALWRAATETTALQLGGDGAPPGEALPSQLRFVAGICGGAG